MRYRQNEEIAERLQSDWTDLDEAVAPESKHVFLAGRCIRCGTDWIDADLPELQNCADRADDAPITYYTDSAGHTHASHVIDS